MSEGKATSHAKMSQCLAPRESPTNISPLLLLLMPPSGGGRERRVGWTGAETSCITTQSKESMSDKDGSRMAGMEVNTSKSSKWLPQRRGARRGAEWSRGFLKQAF